MLRYIEQVDTKDCELTDGNRNRTRMVEKTNRKTS